MNHPWHAGAASLLTVSLLLATGALQTARGESSKLAQNKPPVTSCDREQFRVILDVGHSAEIPGALSARGVGEYTFNLSLAQAIEKKLLEAGFSKTALLITPGKAIAGLVSRVNYATHAPADLFLSIHHDAVPDSFLEKWTYDGKSHNYCDRFKGHSIFISRDGSEYKASFLFGKLLGNQLKAQGLTYTPHYVEKFMGRRQRELVDADAGVYRFDNLVVLRSTNMPAVLFEAGSIINRDEELLMASPEHQSTIAAAVTTAVENYCQAQGSRKPQQRIARRPYDERTATAATAAPPFIFPFVFIGAQH
jgi:N-acetylmuramoyl-L-alanine amidase